ncbi:MAG: hypothetical protein WD877_00235 [Candidatus Saccharimonadales bacterium]
MPLLEHGPNRHLKLVTEAHEAEPEKQAPTIRSLARVAIGPIVDFYREHLAPIRHTPHDPQRDPELQRKLQEDSDDITQEMLERRLGVGRPIVRERYREIFKPKPPKAS